MSGFGWSLALGLAAAAISLLGALLVLSHRWERRLLNYFIAVGSGFMLATALLEMLPKSIELAGERALWLVLCGYLLVHFFEHSLTGHFHFGEEVHPEEHFDPRVGYAAVFGMIIHTFFDGAAIASGFILSGYLGSVIFLAVLLHKIPDGVTVASVMLAAGRGRSGALRASGLISLATLAGVVSMWAIKDFVAYGLALSAGATLYVAASDLIPEVNREPGIWMPLCVFVGAGLMVGLRLLVHG